MNKNDGLVKSNLLNNCGFLSSLKGEQSRVQTICVSEWTEEKGATLRVTEKFNNLTWNGEFKILPIVP